MLTISLLITLGSYPSLPPAPLPSCSFTHSRVDVRSMTPPRWCNVYTGNESSCLNAYIKRDMFTHEVCVYNNGICLKSGKLVVCGDHRKYLPPPSPREHPPPATPKKSVTPPSTSPISPSPPLSISPKAILWKDCSIQDLSGDFNHNGHVTLGDAMWVAIARLQYGATGQNPVKCMGGDFDEDGLFTVNDASFVAQVQFDLKHFPWNHGVS